VFGGIGGDGLMQRLLHYILCYITATTVFVISTSVANGATQLTDFSCDAAIKKSNEIILRNNEGFKFVSFDFDFIGRASSDDNSGMYLTFIGDNGTNETALFWNVPLIGPDGKNLAPNTRGGSHHNLTWGKGEVIDVAQILKPKTETAASGDVEISFKPTAVLFSVPTMLSLRNDFTRNHSLGKITGIKIGCFYGEYELTNINIK
jgi:hypothetical protein